MERIRSFHEKYPGSTSITLLSRVGFNHKIDEALVYRWGLLRRRVRRRWLLFIQKREWRLETKRVEDLDIIEETLQSTETSETLSNKSDLSGSRSFLIDNL